MTNRKKGTGTRLVEAGRRTDWRGRLVNPQTRFWQSYMLAMQPALVRRACFDGNSFDEGLGAFDDLDFYLRVAQRYEFLHMTEPLVKYVETEGLTSDRRVELSDAAPHSAAPVGDWQAPHSGQAPGAARRS